MPTGEIRQRRSAVETSVENLESVDHIDVVDVATLKTKERNIVVVTTSTSDAITMWQSLSNVYDVLSPSQLLNLPSAILIPLFLAWNITGTLASAAGAMVPANTLRSAINGTEVLAQIGKQFGAAVLKGDYSRCANATLEFVNGTIGSNLTVGFPFKYETFGLFTNSIHKKMVSSNIGLEDAIANATRTLLSCFAHVYERQHGDSQSKMDMNKGLIWGAIALGALVVTCLVVATACLAKKVHDKRSEYVPLNNNPTPMTG